MLASTNPNNILLLAVLALLILGIGFVIYTIAKKKKEEPEEADAPQALPPSQTRKVAAPPPGRTTTPPVAVTETPPAPAPVPSTPPPAVEVAAEGLSAADFTSEEPEPLSAADELADDDEDWGGDISMSLDDDLGEIATAEEPEPARQPVDEFEEEVEDEEPEEIDTSISATDDDEADVLVEKELEDLPREIRQAFTQAIIDREFNISKMKEADEISQKCVMAYLDENEVPNARRVAERLFAIHPKIQVSDLPQFVESYLDDGSDQNQDHFADFEEMCEAHEESVLDLFMRFNAILPSRLKCSLVGSTKHPEPAVIFMAPEWEDGDFAKPDFGEDEEDIDDHEDFYEDYYDDLEEIEESEDDLKA